MRLTRFKVINFRSIEESSWIESADNTCLIGTNEAGKTNLLLALWKLNPANGEPIIPLDDFPRHLFSKFESEGHELDVFIKADFELPAGFRSEIAKDLGCDIEQVATVLVCRRYDGKYYITFPYTKIEEFPAERIRGLLDEFEGDLNNTDFFKKETDQVKRDIADLIQECKALLDREFVNRETFDRIENKLEDYKQNRTGRKVKLPNIFDTAILNKLESFKDGFDGKVVAPPTEVRQKVIARLPKFVYYSDYGNLDSEIYLPRVIEDEERDKLSESARAKQRTLNVLFKYVGLSPQEIFELGNDIRKIIKKVDNYQRTLSEEEQEISEEDIKIWSDKKRKRGILLRSAATNLTQNFKKWWQQGDYIFDFQADGNHFRINVSDNLRPEKIELEGRSRGLQWFFSFFLVFLVETKEGHSNAILLLDEPGLSLHPLAQFDLAKFFRKLSEDNQLIYTSHSPFLVDIDNLANVKAVYLNSETGRTEVTTNLRYNQVDSEKSIYPVHAALGLTVSDTLLLGSTAVLVEGVSDQIYLNIVKRILFAQPNFQSSEEYVFIPTGGVRGMNPVSRLVSSRDNVLPRVLLDSDEAGRIFKGKLLGGRYKDDPKKVIEVSDFLGDDAFEIEDLMPPEILISIIDRTYRGDPYFEDVYVDSKPIVPQIEAWANDNGIDLLKGWKVDLSRTVFNRLPKVIQHTESELLGKWLELFKSL
jgi:AAA15 family ATPase/GTPase